MKEDQPPGFTNPTRLSFRDSDWQVQLETIRHLRKLVEDITPAFEEWGQWRQMHPAAHVESIEWIQTMLYAFERALGPEGLAMHRDVLSKLHIA